MTKQYVNTSRRVSVEADCTAQYVNELAREGLLDHIVASDGTKLYPPEAAETVRAIKAQRMARRAWKKAA